MNPLQNPVTLTRMRLIRRTVGPPLAVLTALVVFGMLTMYLVGDGPYCYECSAERIAWKKTEDALLSFFVIQVMIAVLGPIFFGAGFHLYDKRSGVADATKMSPFTGQQRLWGEVVGIAAVPLAAILSIAAACTVPLFMGPIPVASTFLAGQFVVVGLALLSAAFAGRALCSERNVLGVVMLVPLIWLAALIADDASWMLPRVLVGAEIFEQIDHVTSWRRSSSPQSALFFPYVLATLALQALTLFGLLGVHTPRTSSGMRRSLGLIGAFVGLQVVVFAALHSASAAQFGIQWDVPSYRARDTLIFFWLFGGLAAVSLVAMLMPSAASRYRSRVRASLGAADPTRPNVYAAGLGVMAIFGSALFVMSGIVAPAGLPRHAISGTDALICVAFSMFQLATMIAYYELLATKTGARAPAWMVVTAVALIGAVFIAMLAGFDEETLSLLPGVAPIMVITESHLDAETYVGVALWVLFGVSILGHRLSVMRQRQLV